MQKTSMLISIHLTSNPLAVSSLLVIGINNYSLPIPKPCKPSSCCFHQSHNTLNQSVTKSTDAASKLFLKCIPTPHPICHQHTLIPPLDHDLPADLPATTVSVSNASLTLSVPSGAMIYRRVSIVLNITIKGPDNLTLSISSPSFSCHHPSLPLCKALCRGSPTGCHAVSWLPLVTV